MYRATNEILIYGRNMVHDALKSDRIVTKVILADNLAPDPRLKEINALVRSRGITQERISSKSLDHLTEQGSHQGVAAYMKAPDEISLESILKAKRDAFLLLFGPLDYEQNLGSILRTAWAAGVDAVIVSPGGVHEITPVVAKVSTGGAAYVPLISQSLFQVIALLNKYAVKVIGVEVGAGEPYTKATLGGATALVFGSESTGLTEPVTNKCDSLINIPMVESVASLNVATATAVVCFEKNRQDRLN